MNPTPFTSSVPRASARQCALLALLPLTLEARGWTLVSQVLYATTTVHSAPPAAARLRAGEFDALVLDLGLPDEDGLALLRYLQNAWDGPVIVVSGRGEPVEKVVGLELGADDFVSKPFDLRELLARIRSVMRRAAKTTPISTPPARIFEFAGFRLDTTCRQLTDALGDEVALTTGDFQLLCALLEKPRQVLSRDELMAALYRREASPFDRAIDMGIGRLRRKIEPDPEAPVLIRTVRGTGYLFAADVVRHG